MRGVVVLALALQPVAWPALAQDYPTRPVKAIVAVGAGGTGDIFMRVLGEQLHRRWGQPVIVENRPGGASNIGARACADAPPDGYTICIMPGEPLAYNQFLYKKLHIRSRQGLRSDHQSVLQYPGAGGQRRAQGEDGGRAGGALQGESRNPELHRAVASVGALSREAQARARRRLGRDPVPRRRRHHQRRPVGIDADRIPRHAEFHLPPAERHDDGPGGRRRAALAAVSRHSDAGGLGYRGNLTRVYFGLVAPARTPKPIIDKIREDVSRIGSDPAFRQKQFTDRALEPIFNTPEEFARFLIEDRATSERVVKEAGLQPQ